MTFLIERLAELRRHLDHLREIRPRVADAGTLRRDLSVHNDVLFSLLAVCQLVIDVSGELAASRGDRFESYAEAIRSLSSEERFPAAMVSRLERLAGFRNVLVHEYVGLDFDRVIEALDDLAPIEQFLEIVRSGLR